MEHFGILLESEGCRMPGSSKNQREFSDSLALSSQDFAQFTQLSNAGKWKVHLERERN